MRSILNETYSDFKPLKRKMSARIYVWGVGQISCPPLASPSQGNQTVDFPAGWRPGGSAINLRGRIGRGWENVKPATGAVCEG